MKNSKHILLIEDDKNDVELTRLALSECNLDQNTVVVGNGVEALDYLQCRGAFISRSNGNPALIFLDLTMPMMNGVEVLNQIRSDKQLKNIPVIVLSVTQDIDTIKTCREAGANDYVIKPINFKKFVATVKEIGSLWLGVDASSTGRKQ